METTERTAPETAAQPRQRRVGTFTLGVTLVAAGAAMLAAMFFPALDLRWVLKCAPLILILLGIETLLAARGGGKIRYDWMGMLLCFVLTGAALCMCAAAWYAAWWPEHGSYYDGSVTEYESGFSMEYDAFSGRQLHLLDLEAGDTVLVEAAPEGGSVSLEVLADDSREAVCRAADLTEESFSFGVERTGTYEAWVTGERASGSLRVSAEHSPETQDG